MENLFRFVLLRPASPVAPEDIHQLSASFVSAGTPRALAQREARAFLDQNVYLKSPSALKYSQAALAVVAALRNKCQPATDVSDIVSGAAGASAATVVADAQFAAEEKQLADELVAFKLVSDSSGADAAGLAVAAQGYDAIRSAATTEGQVCLRPQSIPDFPVDTGGAAPPPPSPPPAPPPPGDTTTGSNLLARLDQAVSALNGVMARDFQGSPTQHPPAAKGDAPGDRGREQRRG
jgi:hypothetical protein